MATLRISTPHTQLPICNFRDTPGVDGKKICYPLTSSLFTTSLSSSTIIKLISNTCNTGKDFKVRSSFVSYLWWTVVICPPFYTKVYFLYTRVEAHDRRGCLKIFSALWEPLCRGHVCKGKLAILLPLWMTNLPTFGISGTSTRNSDCRFLYKWKLTVENIVVYFIYLHHTVRSWWKQREVRLFVTAIQKERDGPICLLGSLDSLGFTPAYSVVNLVTFSIVEVVSAFSQIFTD